FNSPAGAYANNPRLRGSVGFVFTVADPPNKPTPSGTLVVTLTAGRQVFMSDEIDWMVTTASAAQFHGTGRINGAAGYRFTVTAIDGRPDRIRISVWDASGTVVYDNRPGLPLDLELADPQPINSGVVLIIN
ncbi:MAG TPA: hypothetical protein VEX37_02130, partial [Thermomicrobiales bacterium]|nr:hypothetical protein [Thermomicrobiales bacterium]